MHLKIPRSLVFSLLCLLSTNFLWADREADRRNERIPPGIQAQPPWHRKFSSPRRSVNTLETEPPAGYSPQQLRRAYGFDQLGATGAGQTIAIVVAYGSPTIQADLDVFCATHHIPSTTIEICYPQGKTGGNISWEGETSLDVQWAHAIAPGAKILLVVARSGFNNDLFAAVDYAVAHGATQVSMSWIFPEYEGISTSDYHFNVPGVTFVSGSGDWGAGVNYPGSSPYVVSVGGTSLHLDAAGNRVGPETAWTGSGGGLSAFEPRPAYQSSWVTGSTRGVPDVAYDADTDTSISVYQTSAGWMQCAGTSISVPQWAALFALANSVSAQPPRRMPQDLYSLATADYAWFYHDIVSGSNGQYSAGAGYDLVTGLGSPIADQLVPGLAGGLMPQAAAPVFQPAAGNYSSPQTVSIASATPGASVRYTTNGSTPSETNGTLYSGPVAIGANTTLAAIAYASGLTSSVVANSGYNFIPASVTPAFNPAAGTYPFPQTVTMTTPTAGAAIRYTTDGSTPTETNGTLYSGPVNVSGPVTWRAVAYANGFTPSPVAKATYAFGNFSVLNNFSGPDNGAVNPFAGLVLATDGNFYGTTFQGGSGWFGTIFKMTPAGIVTTLVSFDGSNGATPYAGLTQARDGNFYGTTGGITNFAGTVFKMTPAGTLTTLVSFPLTGENGLTSRGVVEGTDGNFYGTTTYGGASGFGTIFKVTPTGVLSTLVAFNGANGARPEAGLVQGRDGNLYGTTSFADNSNGTVFKVTPAGVLTTLVSFTAPAFAENYSKAALVQGRDGNFYGTTSGGDTNAGTVFRITPTGDLTRLHSFGGADGGSPAAALLEGRDGNFYGTTSAGGVGLNGTVFQITPSGHLTTLVSFDQVNGSVPVASLVQGPDGSLYGTTMSGGTTNDGIVFKVGIPPQAAAPVPSPMPGTYSSAQTVALSSATPGAAMRYTLDGSAPTPTQGTLYAGPFTVSITATLKAIAWQTGFTDSAVGGGIYTISLPKAATPAFSPAPGTYTSIQKVRISSATAGATIRYTMDGSTPTETSGTIYSAPVSVDHTTTLKAVAYKSGLANSLIGAGSYTINLPVTVAPVFTPAPGTYRSTQRVKITSKTSGACIRYTTDGSTPTETHGTLYEDPVTIRKTTTLSAIAYKPDYTDSAVTSGKYTIK